MWVRGAGCPSHDHSRPSYSQLTPHHMRGLSQDPSQNLQICPPDSGLTSNVWVNPLGPEEPRVTQQTHKLIVKFCRFKQLHCFNCIV